MNLTDTAINTNPIMCYKCILDFSLNTALPESQCEGKIQEMNFGQSALLQGTAYYKVTKSWNCPVLLGKFNNAYETQLGNKTIHDNIKTDLM